ncbi:RsmB/NOP family class I SAM-dependent RNA methyltransferase [Puniceibacterium sediminis]|uniref:16S rRNA (Cytosine967-C5)-methyltransferase n=1 Tax=Puniceibacterium sediminis TaxID=1608407 RepID=A0A238XHJ3_9RHOB|nr:RsmB/NOP family class I SAM-dependent RNA methyltransferase [Puniceibacterium sediminis]SNR58058.1 16S rRNA (cytosine967-C5)-methyltransferase [Puniceibacterium sediminis]
MTPAARVQAAIEVLDRIGPDMAAEQALTNWARGARFAGSKDRAAVRDHVYEVMRQRRSVAALGGGGTGRQSMLGLLRLNDVPPEPLFSGEGYGPLPLSVDEQNSGRPPEGVETLDLPDWLAERFAADLGADSEAVARALKSRASVFLRVNSLRCSVQQAIDSLSEEDISVAPHPLSPQALVVVTNARRVAQSEAYQDGWVELQDAASQAVVDLLPLRNGQRVLDYCAGGGGKTLAMAARLDGSVEAFDANPGRLRDLPVRAARAGAAVEIVERCEGLYDLVLCDVPCSGSGAWRRSPEGKWTLTPHKLEAVQGVQAQILRKASHLVRPGGCLAYVTCSVLKSENGDQIKLFMAENAGWELGETRQFLPADGGDGFFVCCLTRL